ncbi:helix-turn-helix transcriptional regulator [Blastococcus sp. URHD0036]|uniref:ArsR/SmtB family transcription factor n=1 Tax=Blastococcus sp. URHD0036 TaxID=1380356 RepID=UPI00068FF5A6|nr:metalloregulator ArsR/SmtB family transcription factor [Blastococcus sp. URHD0036]
MTREAVAATEVFKALGDPIRWNIVQQMAQQEELACSVLEDTLPVSKPTISYHTKILTQAGLIEVRKRGRNYFYSLRREVLRSLMDEMWLLAPGPRLVSSDGEGTGDRAERPVLKAAVGDDTSRSAALLTW